MHNDSYAKSIYIKLINGLLFIVGDDFRGDEAWGSAFREDDVFLVVKGGKSIVYYFEAVDPIIDIKRVLFLEEDVLRLDIAMHYPSFLEILDPL